MAETTTPPAKKPVAKKDALASVALWQFMAFILLLCFVWMNEVLDLPARVFNAPESPFSFFRASLPRFCTKIPWVHHHFFPGHVHQIQKITFRLLVVHFSDCPPEGGCPLVQCHILEPGPGLIILDPF